MFKYLFLLVLVLILDLYALNYQRSNLASEKALKDLDCEFEDCTPIEPKVVVKEKIIYKDKPVEKIIIKEVLKVIPVERVIVKEKIVYKDNNSLECNKLAKAGSTKPEAYQVFLGKNTGQFNFQYETFTAKDRLTVVNSSTILFDSGCIGTQGLQEAMINLNGKQDFVTVQVIPNCENEAASSTKWEFKVNCP